MKSKNRRHDNPLFSSDKDCENNACVNYMHDPMHAYISGYKRAADLLIGETGETLALDILVYPIAFLYRQFIELELKDLISRSRSLLGIGSGFPQNHDIKSLWSEVNELLLKIVHFADQKAGEYVTHEDVLEIRKVVDSFNEIDPGSFAFRYPKDKSGKNALEGLTHINIRKLREKIDFLASRLEKIDTVVTSLEEQKSDYARMMGGTNWSF